MKIFVVLASVTLMLLGFLHLSESYKAAVKDRQKACWSLSCLGILELLLSCIVWLLMR